MQIYFSQAGEDKFLYENIFSKITDYPKSYIEMGALDGIRFSNTKYFEDQHGWSGILIEPNPPMFKKLKKNRPNNYLCNDIISDSSQKIEFTYFDNENLSAVSGVSSTITPQLKKNFYENESQWYKDMRKAHLKKIRKKPISLDEVIANSNIKEFGFCSLDVEGHELHVIKSYSFKYKILFFLIEKNPNSQQIERIMINNSYTFLGDVAHNKLYGFNEFLDEYQYLIQGLKEATTP